MPSTVGHSGPADRESRDGPQKPFAQILSLNPVRWTDEYASNLKAEIDRFAAEKPGQFMWQSTFEPFCRRGSFEQHASYPTNSISPEEAQQSLDQLTLKLLKNWVCSAFSSDSKIRAVAESESCTLAELRLEFWSRKHDLNTQGPINFQFASAADHVNYIHFKTPGSPKLNHGDPNQAILRIYVNCDLAAQVPLAQSLLDSGPAGLHFKTRCPVPDGSKPSVAASSYMIIYACSDRDAEEVLGLLEAQRTKHAEWFSMRKTSVFLSQFGDGIGIGQDPNSSLLIYRYSGRSLIASERECDYTTHRQHMVLDLALAIAEQIMLHSDPARQYHKMTAAELQEQTKADLRTKGIPTLSAVSRRGQSIAAISAERSPEVISMQLLLTARVISSVGFEEFNQHLSSLLPDLLVRYNIDPANIARNLA